MYSIVATNEELLGLLNPVNVATVGFIVLILKWYLTTKFGKELYWTIDQKIKLEFWLMKDRLLSIFNVKRKSASKNLKVSYEELPIKHFPLLDEEQIIKVKLSNGNTLKYYFCLFCLL